MSVKRSDKENTDEQLAAARRSIASETDHLELRTLLTTLRREKWMILGPLVVAMIGLVVYFSVAPRHYSATAQILLDVQKPRIISSEAVVPSLDMTRYMLDPVINSQLEIMRSTRVAERVIERVGLLDDPEYQPKTTFVGAIRNFLGGLLSLGQSAEEADPALDANNRVPSALVAAFLKNLDVRRKGQTLILYVNFTDKRPSKAAEIANAVVDAYLDDQREQKFKAARLANDLLRARVAELRDEVLVAENKLQAYREKNNLISIDGVTVGEQEIAATITQMISARTNAANKLAELRQIERISRTPEEFASLSKVLNSSVIGGLRLQESAVLRNIAIGASKFGENDNRVQSSRAELKNVQKEISLEVARIIENARHDYDVAQSQVRILEQEFAKLRQDSAAGRRLTIEFAELERDAKSSRDLYLNLLSRLKETLVQESLLYPDARIVEPAVRPRNPSGPNKLMLLAFALMGSLGVGVTAALLRDHLSSALRTPRELEKLLGKQVTPLALLPHSGVDICRTTIDQPDSKFTQAIFSINRSLWQKQKTSNSKRVVAVTSVLNGEGKTTTAINLACYSAILGTKTLLIDCDFRTRGASDQFPAAEDKPNLVDLLQGKATASQVIDQKMPSGVHVCRAPRPGSVKNPMELLSSIQMRDLLKQLNRKYQLIILDTSAILTSVDARALIGFADCIIFIVKSGETTTDQVLQAQHYADELVEKTAVVVLNKAEMEY